MHLLLYALFFTAQALAAPFCVTQFGGLRDYFAPIIVSAQSDLSDTAYFRHMTPSERQRAIELVKEKILLAGRLGRAGAWLELLQHLDNPKFMEGTGVTSYRPKEEMIAITPAEAAELSTKPAKLAALVSKMAGTSYWHESGRCCSISAAWVEILDPKTNLVTPNSRDHSPLHRERAALLSEEIAHHLQALVQAQGGRGFISRQMASPDFAEQVVNGLKQHASRDPSYLVTWLTASKSIRAALTMAVARFKAEHPVPGKEVSGRDHAIFGAIPAQFAMLDDIIETGEIATPEGKQLFQQLSKDVGRFLTAFPKLTAPVIDSVVERELREADVYYLLQDLYGSQVIDVAWRNRYQGRKIGDVVLSRD